MTARSILPSMSFVRPILPAVRRYPGRDGDAVTNVLGKQSFRRSTSRISPNYIAVGSDGTIYVTEWTFLANDSSRACTFIR